MFGFTDLSERKWNGIGTFLTLKDMQWSLQRGLRRTAILATCDFLPICPFLNAIIESCPKSCLQRECPGNLEVANCVNHELAGNDGCPLFFCSLLWARWHNAIHWEFYREGTWADHWNVKHLEVQWKICGVHWGCWYSITRQEKAWKLSWIPPSVTPDRCLPFWGAPQFHKHILQLFFAVLFPVLTVSACVTVKQKENKSLICYLTWPHAVSRLGKD